MRWITTPEQVCECVYALGEQSICEMHLRAGYGKLYKNRLVTKPIETKVNDYKLRRGDGKEKRGTILEGKANR